MVGIRNKFSWFFILCCLFVDAAYAFNDLVQLTLERVEGLVASAYRISDPDKKFYGLRPEYSSARPSERIDDDIVVIVKTRRSLQVNSDTTVKFKGFRQYELWLKRVRDNFRFRDKLEVKTMGACINGCCHFSLDGGISHNTFYMQEVCFVIKNNRSFLKSITLLDGD